MNSAETIYNLGCGARVARQNSDAMLLLDEARILLYCERRYNSTHSQAEL